MAQIAVILKHGKPQQHSVASHIGHKGAKAEKAPPIRRSR
jgi:hypothetical protein